MEKTVESPQLQLVEAPGAIPLVQLLDRLSCPLCATTIALVLMRITVEVPQVQLIFMVFHGHARCCARLVLWSRRAEAVNLSFQRVERRRPRQGPLPVASFLQRNKVGDVPVELNRLIEDEMRDTVVLAFANALTSFPEGRSSRELIDERKHEELWWCCADGSRDDTVVT